MTVLYWHGLSRLPGAAPCSPLAWPWVAELFAPEERGKALGVWGTGIMIGPSIGPTLGGYLTDVLNWRSIFSVNLPFGIIAFMMGPGDHGKRPKTPEKRSPL